MWVRKRDGAAASIVKCKPGNPHGHSVVVKCGGETYSESVSLFHTRFRRRALEGAR